MIYRIMGKLTFVNGFKHVERLRFLMLTKRSVHVYVLSLRHCYYLGA